PRTLVVSRYDLGHAARPDECYTAGRLRRRFLVIILVSFLSVNWRRPCDWICFCPIALQQSGHGIDAHPRIISREGEESAVWRNCDSCSARGTGVLFRGRRPFHRRRCRQLRDRHVFLYLVVVQNHFLRSLEPQPHELLSSRVKTESRDIASLWVTVQQ